MAIENIAAARRLLTDPVDRATALPLLCAAGFAAIAAVMMAVTVILGPGMTIVEGSTLLIR